MVFAVAAVSSTGAHAQSAGGTLTPWPGCTADQGQSASTSNFAFWTGEMSGCGVFGMGDSSAGNGYVTGFVSLGTNVEDWSSFGTGLNASASCTFFVHAEASGAPRGLDLVEIPIGIHVSGSTTASSSGTVGGCSASITWAANVAGMNFSGFKSVDSSGASSQQNMSDFNLTMFVQPGDTLGVAITCAASTGASKTFSPFQTMTTSSAADFSSTVQWMGASGPVRGYDANGNEIALPRNFQIHLTDLASGHDFMLPAPTPCRADINHDGTVDASDLGSLLGAWGEAGGFADLDRSGAVDAADLGVLLGSWGCSES
ncbi:MAG: hypothetical protein U0572_09775 [Phycisphaerales bacterium]